MTIYTKAEWSAFTNRDEMMRAITGGDVSVLGALLSVSKGLPISFKDLLKHAFDKKQYACVECILRGTKLVDTDLVESACSALGYGGSLPDHAILELILSNMENHAVISGGMSILHTVPHGFRDVRVVDVILRKITVDIPNIHTLMLGAVSIGTAAVVKRCLEDPRIDPACMDNSPLIEAVKKGNAKMVKLLAADPRVDPAVRDNWAIREASVTGNAEIVTCLMQYRRVDPTARDNECLRWAVYGDHVDVVRALLADRRIDPSVNNNCTIRWAMKEGHYDIVTHLLSDSRVDPSVADNEVMRTAVERGQDTLITFLLTDPRVDVSIVPSGPPASISPELADLTDLF